MVFWSLTNCACCLHNKDKKPHPAWVFLRKMPEKQLILFAWPKSDERIASFIIMMGEKGLILVSTHKCDSLLVSTMRLMILLKMK